jgi:hypothetical protein
MRVNEFQFLCQYNICERMFHIYAHSGNQIVTSFNLATPRPGEYTPPTFRLSENEAQVLIDQLWSCGLRPTEGHGTAGQLAATERHLEDLRSIAFAKLEIPKP